MPEPVIEKVLKILGVICFQVFLVVIVVVLFLALCCFQRRVSVIFVCPEFKNGAPRQSGTWNIGEPW